MPAKVVEGSEEEAEPLKNDVFGSVIKTIKGKMLPGGIRNSITIYENGALITSMSTFKGILGPRGCLAYYYNLCPMQEARAMIPKHRFMGAYLKKQMWCGGLCSCDVPCCCPTLTSMVFMLSDDEEVAFIMTGKLKDEEYNAIFSFVYGDLTTTGLGDKAHALGILANDHVISKPSAAFSYSMNRD